MYLMTLRGLDPRGCRMCLAGAYLLGLLMGFLLGMVALYRFPDIARAIRSRLDR